MRELSDLQAKYNIGDLYRTINVPTLPLVFLLPDRQPRFRFKHTGTTSQGDTLVWVVSYEERDRPTIVRTPEGRDVTSSGSFWMTRRQVRSFEQSFVPARFQDSRCTRSSWWDTRLTPASRCSCLRT